MCFFSDQPKSPSALAMDKGSRIPFTNDQCRLFYNALGLTSVVAELTGSALYQSAHPPVDLGEEEDNDESVEDDDYGGYVDDFLLSNGVCKPIETYSHSPDLFAPRLIQFVVLPASADGTQWVNPVQLIPLDDSFVTQASVDEQTKEPIVYSQGLLVCCGVSRECGDDSIKSLSSSGGAGLYVYG